MKNSTSVSAKNKLLFSILRIRYQQTGAKRRLFVCLPKTLFWTGFWACLSLAWLPAAAQQPPPTACSVEQYDDEAVVSKVYDGDTVKLEDGRKIRLIGINTPELAKNKRAGQPLAKEARHALQQQIRQSQHRVKLVYGPVKQDRYQRTLAHMFTPDGNNLQASLLELGLAYATAHPPNLAFIDCYQRAEKNAIEQRLGLWNRANQAITAAAQLDPEQGGFHLVRTQLVGVHPSGQKLSLMFEGGILASIHQPDIRYFNVESLHALIGKTVYLRGWLIPKSSSKTNVKFYMKLRHPSALTEVKLD